MGSGVTRMLAVGEMARRGGLTTKALRHYDRLGLLVPAQVSSDGYRWYAEPQVDVARTIARLRSLQARGDRIRRAPHSLDHLLNDERGAAMALTDTAPEPATDERTLAARLFSDTWKLLEKEDRTPEEVDRMIQMAHASRLHWDNVGDDQNRAIGEWQVARVYSTLGRSEPARFHAHRSPATSTQPATRGTRRSQTSLLSPIP
jgi:DNA-binding transcriptional MerR regulator